MFISSVRIKNFKGFYGVHDFHLLNGLNVILGSSGEGKTSLCQAIEYGLFGGIWGPPGPSPYPEEHLSDIVNDRHREEHQNMYEFYYTSVEIHVVKGSETYRIERKLSFHDDGEAYEKLHYSTDVKLGLTRSAFQGLIYIDERIPEDHRLNIDTDLSTGERIVKYIEDLVKRNVERGIRMLVLDGALSRLAEEKKSDCVNNIAGQGFDQIILLENPAAYHKGLEVSESKKLLLGVTLERVDVSVEDFPFPPSVLENELRMNLDGAYMVNGDVYEKRVFNEKYSVVFSEVNPEGGRFSENETNLTFETS